MAFFRTKSHRSEWKARRKAHRQAVEDELARADQEQRMSWVNATRRIPEQPQRFDLIAEPGEWEGLA
jgi:hypothetical protein